MLLIFTAIIAVTIIVSRAFYHYYMFFVNTDSHVPVTLSLKTVCQVLRPHDRVPMTVAIFHMGGFLFLYNLFM